MKVRPARPTDAPAIARAHIRSWQAAYRGLLPDEMLDGLDSHIERRTQRWEDILAHDLDHVLVAEQLDEVVGFAHVSRCRDEDHGLLHHVGEIPAIYLMKEAWGLGLGRSLMAGAERLLVEARFDRACLWVLEGNARARRFYEAAGWSADGAEKSETMPGASLHEVRYVKPL